MILNDLECPIHLKVRFTDGTLDVRTLWFRIRPYAQVWPEGAEGEWAGRPSPPLHPCGQLTRCFSAIAELLVIAVLIQIAYTADRYTEMHNRD